LSIYYTLIITPNAKNWESGDEQDSQIFALGMIIRVLRAFCKIPSLRLVFLILTYINNTNRVGYFTEYPLVDEKTPQIRSDLRPPRGRPLQGVHKRIDVFFAFSFFDYEKHLIFWLPEKGLTSKSWNIQESTSNFFSSSGFTKIVTLGLRYGEYYSSF